MSPASYLTAPPRVASGSLAPSLGSFVWDWAVWIALAVAFAAESWESCASAGASARSCGTVRASTPAPPRASTRSRRRPSSPQRRPRTSARRPSSWRRASRGCAGRSRSSVSSALRSPRSTSSSAGCGVPVRVAAIDQGTNTTRLLVADVEDGGARELHRETRITKLGEGVDARGRLLPVPIARVRNTLSDYRRTAESLGAERTLLIATSAVRDAENGEAFLGEIEWSYGFTTRLLSGDDEAEMTRRGIGGLATGTLLVDIGGGSTELVLDDFSISLTARRRPLHRAARREALRARGGGVRRAPAARAGRRGRRRRHDHDSCRARSRTRALRPRARRRPRPHARGSAGAARAARRAGARGAAHGAGSRSGTRPGHRRGRRDPPRDPRRVRTRRHPRERTGHPRRSRSCRSRATGAGRRRRPARRVHLLLALSWHELGAFAAQFAGHPLFPVGGWGFGMASRSAAHATRLGPRQS